MYMCVCVCLQAISVCARATGIFVYDGMSMLLIQDQDCWSFSGCGTCGQTMPNLKPSVLRSLVVLTSDIQDPRQKLSSVIWNDSWILIYYAFCWRKAVWWEHMWPSMQMWAPWQPVDEKVSLMDIFQRKDMFLEVFLPFAREQNLFVWFDGFHFVSGRSSSPRDSWLAPLVNNRQACEVIWYRSRMTNPSWPHRWSCWLLGSWMDLACGSWRSFISGAFPALLKLQWRAMQRLASFHLSWEDSRLCSENEFEWVFRGLQPPPRRQDTKW